MTETLAGVLDEHARTAPARTALICPVEGRIDVETLHRRSLRAAAALHARGVGEGSRVVVIAEDSSAVYELLFACSRLGAILVPLNVRLTSAEISSILDDCQPQVVFSDSARSWQSYDTIDMAEFRAWRDAHDTGDSWRAPSPDAAAVLMYTSGTTGRPKGVLLGTVTFFAIARLLRESRLDWIDWQEGDVSLAALPSFHIGGLWWTVQSLIAGIPTVLLSSFAPERALAAIREHAVTITCLVPAMMKLIFDEPGADSSAFARMRKVVYGGSPMPRALREKAHQRFRADLVQIYGLTETGNTAVCLPAQEHADPERTATAVGRPYPGVDLRVTAPDGADLPDGSTGEIWVRSPAQMRGYWNRPEETAQTLQNGWVRTGDVGFVDEAGLLHLRDRAKDLVIVAGENVYPAEIEEQLRGHPAVRDVAVIGVPDDSWGERVHAVVVVHDTVPATSELTAYLRGRLAGFKIPRSYEFTAELPRNASGKVLRHQLRQAHWIGRDRRIN